MRGEPGAPSPAGGRGRPELAWHRLAAGGHWAEKAHGSSTSSGGQGLRPEDWLLDVGCGSLSAAIKLLPYMERSHYWGYEKDLELYIAGSQIELPRVGVSVELGHFIVNDDFDFADAPHPFDVAIASSLFRRLTLNGIARCIASVVKKLTPDGRFYATWIDNPDPLQFGAVVHRGRNEELQRSRPVPLQLRDALGIGRRGRRPGRSARRSLPSARRGRDGHHPPLTC